VDPQPTRLILKKVIDALRLSIHHRVMWSPERLALSSRLFWAAVMLCVVGGFAAASAITYTAGGTRTVWPQLFYVPIALVAVLVAPRIAVGAAIIAGLLCGPAMPLDRAAGTGQETWSWTLRLGVFVLVALVIAIPATLARKRAHMLERFGGQVVTSFVTAVDGKHPYTARHSESVARYATSIAQELGLPRRAVDRIRWAALLHDVGKISTPVELLDKQGPLTDDERVVMERHPVESARIVEGIDRLADSLDGVRHHHERLDGAGYPDRLAGEAVSLDARVLAVADAFDAMTSDRAYRRGMHSAVALDRLIAEAGTQFDEAVVAAFARSLSVEPPTTEAARDATAETMPLVGSPSPHQS
jgi:putative nucleotidyltransferase with HDIG domain